MIAAIGLVLFTVAYVCDLVFEHILHVKNPISIWAVFVFAFLGFALLVTSAAIFLWRNAP